MDYPETKFEKETLKIFQKEKVMTIEQIAKNLKKSIPTTRLRLKQWHTITSYDKNGRYYVLPRVAKFDFHGLWSYKNIHFSKYGNLKDTLVNIVTNSSTGLDGATIGKILGLDQRSFLSSFAKLDSLHREKISGVFVYFSSEEVKYKKQISERIKSLGHKKNSPLPDAVGIIVLVNKIKHPKSSLSQLTKSLQNSGVPVTLSKVQDFFYYHGLQKKTPYLG